MIKIAEKTFLISTKSTSLLLFVNKAGKVSTEYYGERLSSEEDLNSFIKKSPFIPGTSVPLSDKHQDICLDYCREELSTPLKGDFHLPSLMLSNSDTSVFDFYYESYEVREPKDIESLPTPKGAKEELVLVLKEQKDLAILKLHYFVYEEDDVIGRYVEIVNPNDAILNIHKASSFLLTLPYSNEELISFHGGWADEGHKETNPLFHGVMSFGSETGSSSNRHNPLFFLKKKDTSLNNGHIYGFNLVYSGSYEASIELDHYNNIFIQEGISHQFFKKVLKKGETFATPMAIMSFSKDGINGISKHFQNFVNNSITPKEFQNKCRPVVYNNWEATYWKFNKRKIKSLMRKASSLGIETFVLDDGWFSTRKDDSHGLGNWTVDKKKLPGGLRSLANYANKLGMGFGIWMEPEMVNENADIYKKHPDWILKDDIHKPLKARHQFVLDLTKKEVQDFIYESVFNVLKSANIAFLKWDYNRPFSDVKISNGESSFFFDYIIGLYSVLERIKKSFPDVLFENCASGGNRFDLGMLSYFPQSWMSDDTDSFERLRIQSSFSYGYPLSVMSNHVAAKVSNQLLRYTNLEHKFDVACFGALGYELDITELSASEKKTIKRQIQYYKDHRKTLQFGEISLQKEFGNEEIASFQAKFGNEAIIGIYRKIAEISPKETHLYCLDLKDEELYEYKTRKEGIPLNKFSGLVNMVSPIHLNPDGLLFRLISRHFEMDSEIDEGKVSGKSLKNGSPLLSDEWMAVGYNDHTRLLGDFGSRIYTVKETNNKNA